MYDYKANGENVNQNLSLLYLLGIIEGETIPDKIKQLTLDDWNTIIYKASAHKVAPLLYYSLSNTNNGNLVPDDVITTLHRLYLQSSLINTQKYYELSKVLKALENDNIQAIVLKGFAVAGLIYENIALRPMGDIDLLAKSEDILRINNILSDLGWENKSRHLLTNKQRLTGDLTYLKGSTLIELQSKLYLMPNFNSWENISSVAIDGTNVPILKLDDFLLHLCLHLNKHILCGFSSLVWVCDINEMLKKFGDRIDWNYMIQTARVYNAESDLYRVLSLINSISATVIPLDINKLKKDGLSISIYDIMHIPRQLKKTSGYISNFFSNCTDSRILPTRYKLLSILRMIFPSKTYIILRYTPKRPNLFYLYYPVRFILGIMRVVRELLHLQE
jgi:hypothetical protein